MRSQVVALLALFSVAVNAHFQLQFPAPRGVFVEDDEPTFCDGYTSPATNRTQFPLSGGIVTLNSEHPQWTLGFFISTVQNVTAFANFSQVNGFFQDTGEGSVCLPLDLSKSNATGLAAGQNATIQFVFSGGDGSLFQCADVTLVDTADLSSVACTNGSSSGGGSTTPTSSSSGGSSTPTNSSGSSAAVSLHQAGRAIGLATFAALTGLVLL